MNITLLAVPPYCLVRATSKSLQKFLSAACIFAKGLSLCRQFYHWYRNVIMASKLWS